MSKCTRCGSEVESMQYVQLIDKNRNWCVRTEAMKPICELCCWEIMAFANTQVSPRKSQAKKSSFGDRKDSTEQEEK